MLERMLNDTLMQDIFAQPLWLVAWVSWLMLVNTASLLFLKHAPARWVLLAWIGNGLTMTALHVEFGHTRILGLSHLLWWTPLLIYLWRSPRRRALQGAARLWAGALMLSIGLSLAVDNVDVARYLAGDRAPVNVPAGSGHEPD